MPVYIFTLAILRTTTPSSLFLLLHYNSSMASLIVDFEQRNLLQGFTPPASHLDKASLYDKEAHLAYGRSRDTAIYIPSDVESDTEDEDDVSQLDSSQSSVARTSAPDYLDLTTTEHGAIESEAAVVGVDTASAVSSTQAEAAPAWPKEPEMSRPAEAEPSQQSCEVNHLLIGYPSACQDVNFATPPTSPESQPQPDGKQLRPEPASHESNVMVDAVSDHDACHSSLGPHDSPSTSAHSPQTADFVEVVQASLQDNEIPASSSCDDTIPEARITSPARISDEPRQVQALNDTNSASTGIESEATGIRSGFQAEASSTSPSRRHSHHESLQVHKTMQPKDGDAGGEVSGGEDGLNMLVFTS
ncbi:hypothetical protein FOXYSP1_20500 [Fusarium oxysporum f. sp. phaseoli]